MDLGNLYLVKLGNADLVLDLSQFSLLPQLPHKMACASKVVKINLKNDYLTLIV